MIEKIKSILQEKGVEHYLLNEIHTKAEEFYLIRKNIDMRRERNCEGATVLVYQDFEKNGQKMRGSAAFHVEPENTPEEVRKKVDSAIQSARFVYNTYYEIAQNQVNDVSKSQQEFEEISLCSLITPYLYTYRELQEDENFFVNSMELYAEKHWIHIVNSKGVNVSFCKKEIKGEIIVQGKEPQDVELYHPFAYENEDPTHFQQLLHTALKRVKDRARTQTTPDLGTYPVIFSDANVDKLLRFYSSHAMGSMIYQQYSEYEVGKFVQGKRENITGDLLTFAFLPTEPYSEEGIKMKPVSCMHKGVLQNIQSNCRFASYLKQKPTGQFKKIEVRPGSKTFAQLCKSPCLWVVACSDFQVDVLSGCFGGEIRLAYLIEEGDITPVTGGSVTGNLYEVQEHMLFSKEMQETVTFKGPKYVLLPSLKVAGVK